MIPALACRAEIFQRLTFPQGYSLRYIQWIEPHQDESMEHYTQRLCGGVTFDSTDIVLGVSLGGLVAQRLAACHPQISNIVLVSTSVGIEERSWLFKVASATKIHKLTPNFVYNSDTIKSALVTMKWSRSYSGKFGAFFAPLSAYYYRWAIDRVLEWDTAPYKANVLRLHGEQDSVFPFKNIKNSIKIPHAGHLMVYFNPKSVSKILADKCSELREKETSSASL